MYKIFKKVISFIVCLVVCLALMPSFAIAASKPAPPKGLKGTALSTSSIKLSWKKVKKAKKYIIYRKYGSKFKKMATTRKTSYTVKKLKAGTRYSFKVAVKTAKGTSKQSAAKKVITKKASTPDPEKPVASLPAPKNLRTTSVSRSQINLIWDVVSGAAKYNIYFSASVSGQYSKITESSANTFSLSGLTADTNYYFKVSAIDVSGKEGALTNPLTIKTAADPGVQKLPAPSNLRTTSVSQSQINLAWDAVTGAVKYNVYYATSVSGQYSKITESLANAFSLSGLTENTNYYFKVSAIDVSNTEGDMSGPLTAKTSANPGVQKLPAPSNLRTTSVSHSQINLAWDAVTGAVKYNVYYATSATGQYSKIIESSASTAAHTGLAANTDYYYKVAAVDASNTEGNMSGPLTAKTSADPGAQKLPAPVNLRQIYKDHESIGLAWDAVPNAVRYNIYVATAAAGPYEWFDWGDTEVLVQELQPSTSYYFKVAVVDINGQEGVQSGFITQMTSARPAAAAAPSFAIYGYTYPSPAGSGYMRVHFQRQAAGNTTYASGSTVTIRQYYSTDKGKNWILEDDTRDAGWSGFDPEFYMDFPLGSTRASKFTLVINNVESLACVINPYAILPPCPKYSGQTYPTMYRSAIEYSNRYGPGDPAVFGLKWNSVPGAAGYDVYMNTVGGYSFTMYLLTSTSGTSISCRYSTWNNQNIIKPTVWGPQYFVKIFARNSEGYQSPFCTYSTVIMTCNDAANDWHGFSY